jgi:hypothetical protein
MNKYNEDLIEIFKVYDLKNLEYNKYIRHQNVTNNKYTNLITMHFDNNETVSFNCEFAGMFDSTTKIWTWSWVMPEYPCYEVSLSYQLLNHAITYYNSNIESLYNFYRSVLTNSHIIFNDELELDNHIAIITYQLRNRIKFIYNHIIFLDNTNTKYIINYYYMY